MPNAWPELSIRWKLVAAFVAVACFVALFVGVVIAIHFQTIERAAQLEGAHVAELIADAATENNAFRPNLQEYLGRLNSLRKRDFVVVDAGRKGLADADSAEVGVIYTHDPHGEVGETVRDGRTRFFVEKNLLHPEGARQVVVALKLDAPDPATGALGAVILEYTGIHEALFATAREEMYLLIVTGVTVVLLLTLFGFDVSRRIAQPVRDLTSKVERITALDYTARVTVTSRDELGQLGVAFNKMAGDLDRGHAELLKTNTLLRGLNRVYAVSSGINALIARVSGRDELFGEACRIAVEEGHFAKAWVGIVDRGSKELRMVAAHGGNPLFFTKLEISLKEKFPAGRGYVAQAVATLRPAISNDMASDPELALKDFSLDGGAGSLAVLPLVVAGETVGVLTLNADVPGFFDAEEMKLLTELAGNIAFAIDHLEKRTRLDYLASYDELTGLANRRLFLERLTGLLGKPGGETLRFAVLVIDIERFRSINESAGRPAGDELLRLFTSRLQSRMADPSWLARIGGDQFASIIPAATPSEAVQRIEQRMNEVLSDPFALEGLEVRVALKIGMALFPADGSDAATLLRNAEAALKKAKAAGERYMFYAKEMTARVAENLALENRLRVALDKEEFVLHYQPKVNLQTGKLTSAEALIRWNDPRTGLVPPGHFIPILEETGLILEVGRWALRKALEDYLRWRTAGLPAVRIAVNVSPLQLRNRGFTAEIGRVVGIHENAAAGLELEITESVIMQDIQHNIECLAAIRAMGVTVAIDDFGTGFSSLAYLSKLPLDTLKIDRSFVVGMTTGPSGMALVSTVIKLAHSLQLKVVAEGVETQEQSNFLRLLSCDEMQGFLFSKAVPAEDFEAKFLALSLPDELVRL